MFFYDHDMARDDMFDMEPEPKGELDILDGLRAMSMFKKDPGPLRPSDLNQEIKYALSENADCIEMLFHEGFLDESLVRELEQMVMDNQSNMMQMPRMTEPGVIVMTQGVIMDETGSPKKKKNIPTNPKLYARVKAEAKRKFDVYPSAYANAWLVRTYKKRGGGYRKG
tara:strand:- start:518 stop:1021 length:504 start_codon:yes stop_codon:yes gene_type:complete